MCSLLHCIDRPFVSVFHKVVLCFQLPRQWLSNDIMKGFHLQSYQSVDAFFLLSLLQKGRFALHNLHRNSDGKQEKQPLETRHHGKQWWSTSSQTAKASGLSTDSTHPVFSGKIMRKTHKKHTIIICHLYDKENHSYMTYMSLRLLKRWEWWRIQRTESSLWQMFMKIGIQHRIRILDTSTFILGEWTNNLNRLPLQKWQVWELAQQKNNIVRFAIGSL